ncbi:mitochondrial AAA ATPase [Ceratocystis lukuohia]|uniref:Mitochondrial AAA ATPase n=1 Tax=Ceratocystis lukuohia TaxID=2019550 RepID=A0ABR4ME69_9PEZI
MVASKANTTTEGISPETQELDTLALIRGTTSTDAATAAVGAGAHNSQNSDNKTKDQPSTSHPTTSTSLTSFPPISFSSSSCPPLDSKKGLYPHPQHIPEPQLLTLKPEFYQPKEFNSFDHPAPPAPVNNDFDISLSGATPTSASNMIFTELYRSRRATLSKVRSSQSSTATPNDASAQDFDPNLLSRDKSKQREAIRKYLAKNVKNDWEFAWTRTDVPALPVVVRRKVVNGAVTEVRYHDPAVSEPAATTSLAQVLKRREGQPASAANPAIRDSGEEADSASENEYSSDDDDNESVYSVMTEDETRFKPRLEWDSELSSIDSVLEPISPELLESASPHEIILLNKERRRKALKEEMKWNQGLACFEIRRNKWTCAKVARLRPKTTTLPIADATSPSTSPRSPRRLFFRHSVHSTASAGSPTSTNATSINSDSDVAVNSTSKASIDTNESHSTSAAGNTKIDQSDSKHEIYPVETLLPVAPPLLPPQNPMRASISPKLYLALYDRTIIQSMTPSCPINLSDMLPACVAGWMRDGEWPPKTAPPPSPAPARSSKTTAAASNPRRRSFGFLTREEEGAGVSKGFRRGIQKVLGLGGSAAE